MGYPSMPEKSVVIITGASSGIGAASAKLLAKAGYRTVLAARREERIKTCKEEILSKVGDAIAVRTDVSDLESIQNLVNRTIETYGQIDVLFNNAGFARQMWLEEMDSEGDILHQVQVNLLGVLRMTQAVLPHMIERRSGHIINMSSMAGFVAPPTYSVYSATKYAVRGFCESLRREVGVWGIKVSGIYPASVETEFSDHLEGEYQSDFLYPKAFRLSAEDVAAEVVRVVQSPKREVILPRIMHFSKWLNILFPGLIDRIIERAFVRPERGL
jgi:short-subunit dehydrogenase